ncbi:hypothetical protein [Rhodococcus sp. AW25M09]|uniref:hypothetical protein n=1 Tax=Rhodococcus sp. AW25M09 TaxID=1268303 RepID=UPI0012F85E90|nr:hypothetical protein [Rhodococcus sp. AW25M09]
MVDGKDLSVATTALSSTLKPRRMTPILTLVACVIAVAVAVLPSSIAQVWPGSGSITRRSLETRVRPAFVEYWATGEAKPGVALAQVVAYWQGFHVVKAVAAALLLTVLAVLLFDVWRRYVAADRRGRRWALGTFGALGALASLVALLIVVANIQGSVAPLSSVVSFLPTDGSDQAVATTADRITAELRTGASTPVLDALVSDFRVYHAAVVVSAGLTTLLLLAGGIAVWRRSRLDKNERRLRGITATVMLLLALSFGVVAAANLSTVIDPASALLAFFAGGGS